jgi:membrane protease YdiL (CAAX protease family)
MNKREINGNNAACVMMAVIVVSFIFAILVSDMLSSNGTVLTAWGRAAITVVNYALLFTVFVVFMKRYNYSVRDTVTEFGINKKPSAWDLALSVVMALICIAAFIMFTTVVIDFFKLFGYNEPIVTVASVGLDSPVGYVVMIVTACLLPAVIEELLFRGIILKGLTQYGKVAAILISALMFMVFHFSAEQTVHQFAMGVVLAAIMLKTGNIVYCMVLHFVNNFFIITYTYIAQSTVIPITFTPALYVLAVFVAVAGFIALLYMVKLFKAKREGSIAVKKLFTMDNMVLFVGLGLSVFLWIVMFAGYFI